MFPERPVHLVGSEPRLRGHLDQERGLTFAGNRSHQMKAVIGVQRGHVAVKGGDLARRKGSGTDRVGVGGQALLVLRTAQQDRAEDQRQPTQQT